MAAPTYVQSVCGRDASSATVSVTLPGTPVAGNYLLCWYSSFASKATMEAAMAAAGWTIVSAAGVSGAGDSMAFGYKVLSGSPSAVQTVRTGNSDNGAVSMVELSGVTAITDGAAATQSTSPTVNATPNNTTASANTMMLAANHFRDASNTGLGPSTMSGGSWTRCAGTPASTHASLRTAAVDRQVVVSSGTLVANNSLAPAASYDRGVASLVEVAGSSSTDVTVNASFPGAAWSVGTWTVTLGVAVTVNASFPGAAWSVGAWEADVGEAISADFPGAAWSVGTWTVTVTTQPVSGRGVISPQPVPDIKIRGIRTPIPQGYVLGRSSKGTGDVELLPLSKLGEMGLASKADAASGKSGFLTVATTLKTLMTAAADLSGQRAVMATAVGEADYPSIATLADGLAMVGITEGAIEDGASGYVITSGELIEGGWTWTPRLPIYVGDLGVLTQSIPAGAWQLQIATAISATKIAIDPRFVLSTP